MRLASEVKIFAHQPLVRVSQRNGDTGNIISISHIRLADRQEKQVNKKYSHYYEDARSFAEAIKRTDNELRQLCYELMELRRLSGTMRTREKFRLNF